jgi:hypothetical protein
MRMRSCERKRVALRRLTGSLGDFLKALIGSTRAVPLVDVERVKQQQEQQRSRSLQEQTLCVVRTARRWLRLCTTTFLARLGEVDRKQVVVSAVRASGQLGRCRRFVCR